MISECFCGLPGTVSSFLRIKGLQSWCFMGCVCARVCTYIYVVSEGCDSGLHFHLCFCFNDISHLWAFPFVCVTQYEFFLTMLQRLLSRAFRENLWCQRHNSTPSSSWNHSLWSICRSLLSSVLRDWGCLDYTSSQESSSKLVGP